MLDRRRSNTLSWDWQLTYTATSSCYFSEDGDYVFSAGGPGARINAITDDGGIGEQVDEMFFVPEQDIPNVDKTRQAVVKTTLKHTYCWQEKLTFRLFSFMAVTLSMSTSIRRHSSLTCEFDRPCPVLA